MNLDLESAFKKITSAIPSKNIAKLERMEGMFLPLAKGSRRPSIDKNLFELIQLALLYQNPVTLEYKPRRENRSFQMEIIIFGQARGPLGGLPYENLAQSPGN